MLKLADCLLVIDLQNGVCKSEQPVARLNQLIKALMPELMPIRRKVARLFLSNITIRL